LTTPDRPDVAARLQVLTAALLFSTGGAAIKATSLGAWQVASFRSGVAALALLVALRPGRWWDVRSLAVGVAYAATMVLFVTGNKLTTAANTIFLQSTAPMYLLLLGPLLLGERVRRSQIVFTAVLACGMAMFFVGIDTPVATAPDPVRGNVIAAISGVTWALSIAGLRWLGRSGGSALGAVVAGNAIAFAVCLGPALPVAGIRAVDVALVLFLGVFQIGLAYAFLTRGVRHVPALEASLLLLLEPVLNVVWAWLVHGETPGPWSSAGCAVIFAATVAWSLRAAR
jgi:drug/metabolite transporter (DMT)-like permease